MSENDNSDSPEKPSTDNGAVGGDDAYDAAAGDTGTKDTDQKDTGADTGTDTDKPAAGPVDAPVRSAISAAAALSKLLPTSEAPVRPAAAKKEAKPLSAAEEEIEAAIARSSIKDKKHQLKKKRIKRGIILLVGALLVYGIYLLLAPFKGTMAFGICRVFLELNVQYPQTLRLSTVEEFGTSVRIWYTQVDSFGEYRLEPIQCYFRADETYGFVLDRITVRRRDVDPEIVAQFNKTLPTIFAHPPDLILPTPLEDSLRNLQINHGLFRKPIL